MAERVSSLLRRSVEHLEEEVPDSYRLLVTRLGPMVVELDVDGEVFSLRGGGRLRVADGAAQEAGVRIGASRGAILDLVDAAVGLNEAVEAGRIRVRGSLDDVQRAHDSLMAYVHAAVRASSHPRLLSELRAGKP
ncbi:SCP-2 sterol transfer family protein [Mycobacterium sp. E2699]|uniref:SCP2 sterol-binding domain-containing protein n=1 Tax=Mycobacterium sp. E2699 TaxID=1834137 RepID=UPI0007FBDEF0|nr:SCP2 sterol-binding domain-containing protein [Mycobacterium sp. E2699]OBH04956.1 SCP-2 sterol transfer family protein [Mycobacterium sp. E2699]